MIKRLFPFLIIPAILFASVLESEYSFSKPVITRGAAIIEGCRFTRDAFAPLVPVKPIRVLIPYGEAVESFDVVYDNPIYLDGKHYLAPFRPGGKIGSAPPKDYLTRSSSFYDRDAFYPSSVKSQNFYTMRKNGHSIFIALLHPVQYNPVTGKIRYYNHISVSINTRKARNVSVYKCNAFIRSQLKRLVDNPAEVDKLPDSKTSSTDYDYLIITTDALKDAYDTFMEFNKRRGLRTRVQTVDYIKSNIDGTDDADRVRNYIIQEYENNNIKFVLLGEDDDNNESNDVPHRGLRAQMYDYGTDFNDDKDIAADMYFSCLDGDWKGSNQYYGEPGSEDIGWEVYASRFAVDDKTELNNIVNKTIKYSEQPVTGEALNSLLLGEYAWGPPDHPVECWGGDCMEQLDGQCTANNYTTYGFPSSWSVSKLYDKNTTWSKSTLISKVKSEKITWINHVGHSNNTYIFKLYNSDVNTSNFTNDGSNANFFLGYTYGCYPGAFDNRTMAGSYTTDCIAEQFTAAISTGCVAFISNTRVGLGDDGTASADGTDGSSQRYIRYFHDAVFGKKIHYLEMMNAYSKEVNTDLICIPNSDIKAPPYFGQMKWCAYQLCALGDPALSIWTADPQELQADHPAEIASTATKFSWDTKKAYTTVALLDGARGDIICSQITGEDGKCEITDDAFKDYVSNNPGGKLGIVVKAHNYLPYSGEILINQTGITTNADVVINNRIYLSKNMSRIYYSISTPAFVNITILNSKGALLKTIVNTHQNIGEYSVIFQNRDLSNGVYYMKMRVDNKTVIKSFVLTK